MLDPELLQLCDNVYQATKLDTPEEKLCMDCHELAGTTHNEHRLVPLYSFRHLLQPGTSVCRHEDKWRANHITSGIYGESDTSLKALLELTLALHKEGLLDD